LATGGANDKNLKTVERVDKVAKVFFDLYVLDKAFAWKSDIETSSVLADHVPPCSCL